MKRESGRRGAGGGQRGNTGFEMSGSGDSQAGDEPVLGKTLDWLPWRGFVCDLFLPPCLSTHARPPTCWPTSPIFPSPPPPRPFHSALYFHVHSYSFPLWYSSWCLLSCIPILSASPIYRLPCKSMPPFLFTHLPIITYFITWLIRSPYLPKYLFLPIYLHGLFTRPLYLLLPIYIDYSPTHLSFHLSFAFTH